MISNKVQLPGCISNRMSWLVMIIYWFLECLRQCGFELCFKGLWLKFKFDFIWYNASLNISTYENYAGTHSWSKFDCSVLTYTPKYAFTHNNVNGIFCRLPHIMIFSWEIVRSIEKTLNDFEYGSFYLFL